MALPNEVSRLGTLNNLRFAIAIPTKHTPVITPLTTLNGERYPKRDDSHRKDALVPWEVRRQDEKDECVARDGAFYSGPEVN